LLQACGNGKQRVRWLGHVAIARYDDKSYQGWLQLGIPTAVEGTDGTPLDFGAVIKDVLQHDQHVVVTPSMNEV
jgi:hypothetical protein